MCTKLLTGAGARSQFIEAAAISRAIPAFNASRHRDCRIREVMVRTSQHDDNMSTVFLQELNMPELNMPEPAYHLGVGSGSRGAQTAMLRKRSGTS